MEAGKHDDDEAGRMVCIYGLLVEEEDYQERERVISQMFITL